MNKAKISDYDAIVSLFKKQRGIFTHISEMYLKEQIYKKTVIYQDGVVIIARKNHIGVQIDEKTVAEKNDWFVNQIVATRKGNGSAKRVFKEFLKDKKTVWLYVKRSNKRAVNFYKKMGFKIASRVTWFMMGNKNIPGYVMVRKNTKV